MPRLVPVSLGLSLLIASGCAAAPAVPHAPPVQTGAIALFDPLLADLSRLREAPSVADVERRVHARATPVSRTDPHQHVRFANSAEYIRVTPVRPSGAGPVAPDPMAAFVSPVIGAAPCLTVDQARADLEAAGWTAPPPLLAERHLDRGTTTALPGPYQRHDGRMKLYLFASGPRSDCVTRYALLWRMEIAGLTMLAPSLAR